MVTMRRALCKFVTPTLTGALRSAFLTVTTPGHNWLFRDYEYKVKFIFLYLMHPPAKPAPPCLASVVRIGLGTVTSCPGKSGQFQRSPRLTGRQKDLVCPKRDPGKWEERELLMVEEEERPQQEKPPTELSPGTWVRVLQLPPPLPYLPCLFFPRVSPPFLPISLRSRSTY